MRTTAITTRASRLLAGLCLALPGITTAGEGETTEAIDLAPVTVSAPGLSRDLLRTPAAVATVDGVDLRQGRQGLQLDEALNRVPGILFQNRYNFAQNLRISIRGFGARAPFGVRGIRLRVDGLPETLPDGQSQVDAIDLESVHRVEVIRGPAAAVYGNAAGGVIDVHTAERIETGHGLDLRIQGGSDDFRRLGARGNLTGGAWHGHVSAWDLEYDGFRNQSRTGKRMAHGRLVHEPHPGRSLTTVLTALDQPLGEDPGGLTRAEVEADRRGAAPNAVALDAGQQVQQQRIGWLWQDEVTLPGEIGLRAFYTRREFEQQLPFIGPSRIEYDRNFFGAGADYTDRARLFGRPLHYLVGAEVHRQRDDRRRFDVDGDGGTAAQRQAAIETATASGLFGQVDLGVTERLDLTLGGRADRVRLAIDDRFTADGAASGSRSYDEFSVMAGLGWQWRPRHRVYANIGTAFETPTFTEFHDPTEPAQGFDPALEPQQAVNVETGLKGQVGPRLRYDLALFLIRTRDEIVQVATDPDRYANAARTRRAGLELGLEYAIDPEWTLSTAYTASRFRFREFVKPDGESLRGHHLPGLPAHMLFSELAWRSDAGRWAVADLLVVGRRYADNENEVDVAGHAVVNLRAGRTFIMATHRLEVFAAVNNLADRDYYSNLRVNADFGRHFEPAPGRNYYAGVSARF